MRVQFAASTSHPDVEQTFLLGELGFASSRICCGTAPASVTLTTKTMSHSRPLALCKVDSVTPDARGPWVRTASELTSANSEVAAAIEAPGNASTSSRRACWDSQRARGYSAEATGRLIAAGTPPGPGGDGQ